MVGFPQFWQTAYDLRPAAFEANHALDKVQMPLLRKPVRNPLQAVIRHMTRINLNSLSEYARDARNERSWKRRHEDCAHHVGDSRDSRLPKEKPSGNRRLSGLLPHFLEETYRLDSEG